MPISGTEAATTPEDSSPSNEDLPSLRIPADSRSVLTNAASLGEIDRVIAGWSPLAGMPANARRVWERACGQFRLGPASYENYTQAVETGFKAVEAMLRHYLAAAIEPSERLTLGRLIERGKSSGLLSNDQHTWLKQYALRVRNALAHPDNAEPLTLSPGMAATMMAGIASFMEDVLSLDR